MCNEKHQPYKHLKTNYLTQKTMGNQVEIVRKTPTPLMQKKLPLYLISCLHEML